MPDAPKGTVLAFDFGEARIAWRRATLSWV